MNLDLPTLYRAFENRAEIEALIERAKSLVRDGIALANVIAPGALTPAPAPAPGTLVTLDVKWLQGALNAAMPGVINLTVDGDYGPATHVAVRRYQQANGLVVDGWAGTQTCARLFAQTSAST